MSARPFSSSFPLLLLPSVMPLLQLKALHPAATSHVEPAAAPVHDAPSFTADRVREALCSFAPWSLWLSPQSASAMRSCRFVSLRLYPSCLLVVTPQWFYSPSSLVVCPLLCRRARLLCGPCAVVTPCEDWWPSVSVWEARLRLLLLSRERIMEWAAVEVWK